MSTDTQFWPPWVAHSIRKFAFTLVTLLWAGAAALPAADKPLRPPAVPLVVHDPYLSIWSEADRLTDVPTTHWTGEANPLTSMIRIDGKAYRLMGWEPALVPALPQTELRVFPTRTIYTFQNKKVQVVLTFLTPALPDSIEVMSRPLTYLTWQVSARDDQSHQVALYFDCSSMLAVDSELKDRTVSFSREKLSGLVVMRMGATEQPILKRKGDTVRIDWGYAYVAGPAGQVTRSSVNRAATCQAAFVAGSEAAGEDDLTPRLPTESTAAAVIMDVGAVGPQPQERRVMLAYDEVYAIDYFGTPLRPYWRRKGMQAPDLLLAADREYAALRKRCLEFDDELMADLTRVGGSQYAEICALVYRQDLGANKIAAGPDGTPWMFCKENLSNGDLSTSDIFYSQAPLYLLLCPALVKGMLAPTFEYVASGKWPYAYAPHDLGKYPQAEGQTYGMARDDGARMPVEECSNLILVLAAEARAEGNARFAVKYWPIVRKWAEYLRDNGLDPVNQLTADDDMPREGHSVNLSAKAICALGAFAQLGEIAGYKDEARNYREIAKDYAQRWVKMADDGAHFRMLFNQPGTWSLKYNLVWDRTLDLNLFPPEVVRKEFAFYQTKLETFGIPMDAAVPYTRFNWTAWAACLAEDQEDFEAIIAALYAYVNTTPSRRPLPDRHYTSKPYMVKEGHENRIARSVVGAVFLRALQDRELWEQWSSRASPPVD